MIRTFGDSGTEDLYDGVNSKRARQALPVELHRAARRKLDWINHAPRLEALRVPPNNRLEALAGNLEGWWSIRINDQYRIVFQWADGNAFGVKVTDYH